MSLKKGFVLGIGALVGGGVGFYVQELYMRQYREKQDRFIDEEAERRVHAAAAAAAIAGGQQSSEQQQQQQKQKQKRPGFPLDDLPERLRSSSSTASS